MIVLSVNAGSSSLKFQAYDMPEENVLISGVFERIGMKESFYTIKLNGEKIKKEVELKNHERAFEILMEELIDTSNMRHFTSYSENGVSWSKMTTDLESLQDLTPNAG